jgi:hypothetical protein
LGLNPRFPFLIRRVVLVLFEGLLIPIGFVNEEGVLVGWVSIEVEPKCPRLTLSRNPNIPLDEF